MKKSYNSKDTMMDERLIGEYKDEIKLEIARMEGIDLQDEAEVMITNKSEMLKDINNKFNDTRTSKKK